MMYPYRSIALLICLSVFGTGCSVLFSEQEWSENYVLTEGVQASSPQTIDGKLNTIGESTFPAEVAGMSPASEVVITLPEKKLIRRIVVHSDNLLAFDIHADRGGLSSERDWYLVKEVRRVQKRPIELSVLTPFPTDRIRLRVLETKDDALEARAFGARMPGWQRLSNRRTAGKIREIELYGYKTSEAVSVEAAVDKREKALDDLLELEQ